MLPYALILRVAAVVLAIRYVIDRDASLVGRPIVIALVIGSFFLPASTNGQIARTLMQVSVSLFVLLWMKVRE